VAIDFLDLLEAGKDDLEFDDSNKSFLGYLIFGKTYAHGLLSSFEIRRLSFSPIGTITNIEEDQAKMIISYRLISDVLVSNYLLDKMRDPAFWASTLKEEVSKVFKENLEM